MWFELRELTVWVLLLSAIAMFIPILDIPVFWPVLLFYMIYILYQMVVRQRQHMNKYSYTLSDFFKPSQSVRSGSTKN